MLPDCSEPQMTEKILDYARGKLSSKDAERVEAHLKDCPTCTASPILQCAHPEIGFLVPSFQLGQLNKEQSRLCIGHLLKCESCRAEYIRDIPLVDALEQIQKLSEQTRSAEDFEADTEVERLLKKLKSGKPDLD